MQHGGGKTPGTSPPTLLQQLQLQHQQQAAQRQQDRQHTSQLFSHALSSSQLLSSSAASSAASPLSSSYHSHQYAAPISAASANVFRSPPPLQSAAEKYGLISANASGSSLLSSAPSGQAGSTFSSSPFSAPATPLSSLYSSYMPSPAQSKPMSEASSFPSSGTSTPTLASSSNLHSLLYPQGLSQQGSSLSALSSLQLNQANQLAPYLQLAGAGLLQRNPRMSLNDSLSALNYLSNNTSSPFSSFPGTPTAAAISAAMPSPLSAGTARFTKAIALESEPYDGLVGMKGNVVGRVKRACGNCKAAKTKCDSERPCRRCSRTGRSSTCNDSVHKKRGRKKYSGGGEGGEEGDGGDSGDEGDEEEGGHSPHEHHETDGHSDHHVDKKAKGAEQAESEQLKLFLLDCALKFRKHLDRWKNVHQQQPQPSAILTNALRWFTLISRADSLRKLLYTGKDGIQEDAHTTDIDLLVDGPDVDAALEAAQREIEGSSNVPGYVLPLYPIPYCLSPATFLSPKPADPTHPPPRVAFFNDAFSQLLSASTQELTSTFAHLPSFLARCSHPHLDQTIGALVDAICSGRPSVTVQSKYADSTGHTYEAIESVSIHSVHGVPIALAITLHSIVSHDGGRVTGSELSDDPEVAKLLDGDSDDEVETSLSTPAGGTTTGPDSDASPLANALGRVELVSPSASSVSSSLPPSSTSAAAVAAASNKSSTLVAAAAAEGLNEPEVKTEGQLLHNV